MVTGTERFPVIESPQRLPGSCFSCSGSVGPFIDTGRQLPMYGHVYICDKCITEMARMLGIPATVEVPDPNSITKEEYEATLDGLRDDVLSSVNSLLGALSNRPHSVLPDPELPGDTELPAGDEGTSTSADRTSAKDDRSVSVEGPVSVPSNSGDGPNIESPFDE